MAAPLPSRPDRSLAATWEARLAAFERAWHHRVSGGAPPRWQDFLPPPGQSCPVEFLFWLLSTDVECRAGAGLPGLLSQPYFEDERLRRAGITRDSELAAELVRREYQVRWRRGERARRRDYIRHFGGLQKKLEALIPELVCPQCGQHGVPLASEEAQSAECPDCGARVTVLAPSSPAEAPTCAQITPDASSVTDAEEAASGMARTRTAVTSTSAGRGAPLRRVGRFRVSEEIARGGMGAVLRGHDKHLRREVAIKVLLDEHTSKPELLNRFIEEAQIAGQLQHPGVVPIYEMGRLEDRRPYFAMKLVKGQTLAALLTGRKDPSEDLPRFLGIFEQVCQAVAYAHSKHVIHRDLKPSNVMVGAFGEVQLMDWGLAKVLHDGAAPASAAQPRPPQASSAIRTVRSDPSAPPFTDTEIPAAGMTSAGSILGTAAYMSPEQAAGQVDSLDERCDVFGLGAILCEILTGKPPYVAPEEWRLLYMAGLGELDGAFARLKASGADRELVRLTRDCLSREPAKRPRNAAAVVRRVAAYQRTVQERLHAAERERAAADARAQEARATAASDRKRHRLAVVLAGVVVAALCLGGGAAAWYRWERGARRTRAQAEAFTSLREAEVYLREHRDLRDGSPERWHTAVRLARAAVARAEVALAEVGNDAVLADQVMHQRAEVDFEWRDSTLRLELDEIRLEQAGRNIDGGWPRSSVVPHYQAVLGRYGIDLTNPNASGARIASSRLRSELLAALRDWMQLTPIREEKPLLEAVLRAAEKSGGEAEAWRPQWREAVQEKNGAALAALVRQAGEKIPAAEVANMAADLIALGQVEPAIDVLRRGRERFPDDFWINHDLGIALMDQEGKPGEGIPYLMVATALRPQSPGAHNDLGCAMHRKGDLEGALRCYRKALDLNPKFALAHSNIGAILKDKGDIEGSMRCSRKAIELNPKFALPHCNLGNDLKDQGDLEGAIRCYRQALDLDADFVAAYTGLSLALAAEGYLDAAISCCQTAIERLPRDARTHNSLGAVLLDYKHDPDAAIEAFRKALQLQPTWPDLHSNLGNALKEKGDIDAAIQSYRKALELNPTHALAKSGLGNALLDKGDVDGAIAACREAIQLAPRLAEAPNNLGRALAARGDTEGALGCYRRALKLDPRLADALGNLANALLERGEFEEARDVSQRYQKALPLADPRRAAAARLVQQCERMTALEAKFSDFAAGKIHPADAQEALDLARLCATSKHQSYRLQARLYAEAFAVYPQLLKDMDHCYNAACAAALAGCGKGKDAEALEARGRARLRGQSLHWLRAHLDAWSRRLADARPAAGQQVLRAIRHLQQDSDLAGVRDETSLSALPSEERDAWKQFWADVGNLARKAEGQK